MILSNHPVGVSVGGVEPYVHAGLVIRHHVPGVVPYLVAKVFGARVHFAEGDAPRGLGAVVFPSVEDESPRPVWGAGVVVPTVIPPSEAVAVAERNLEEPLPPYLPVDPDDPGADVGLALVEAEVLAEVLPAGVRDLAARLRIAEVQRHAVHVLVVHVVRRLLGTAGVVLPRRAVTVEAGLRAWLFLVVSGIQTGRNVSTGRQAAVQKGDEQQTQKSAGFHLQLTPMPRLF